MFPSVVPRLTTDSAVRLFPGVWKLLFKTPFPGQSSVPTSFVSFFVFYIFSYLLSKTLGCFSGRLMSSAGIQKFCGIYSVFKCSFDEFVGEKVISPSYSSTILRPPHTSFFFKVILGICGVADVLGSIPSLLFINWAGRYQVIQLKHFCSKHLMKIK